MGIISESRVAHLLSSLENSQVELEKVAYEMQNQVCVSAVELHNSQTREPILPLKSFTLGIRCC